MTLAFLFPGQGSHRPGMASVWAEHPAHATFDEVSRATGLDLARVADDADACAATALAQPAVYAASIAAWRALLDAGVVPDVVAGHSLGEIAAAVAAGCLEVADGARLVAERGRAMGEACAASPGGMVAVLGLDDEAVGALRARIQGTGAVLANDNAPGQVVLAGPEGQLDRAAEVARELGGRVRALDVEGAFHSPAMTPGVVRVAEVLRRTTVEAPHTTFLSGSTGAPVTTAAGVATALAEGVLAPVRWRDVQTRLGELGVTAAVEVGPGGVLRGLARRALPGVEVHAVDEPERLAAFVRQHTTEPQLQEEYA